MDFLVEANQTSIQTIINYTTWFEFPAKQKFSILLRKNHKLFYTVSDLLWPDIFAESNKYFFLLFQTSSSFVATPPNVFKNVILHKSFFN